MFVDEKAVGEPKPIQVGTLKLSTAIRIGASKRPQIRGRFFNSKGSCALGAAWEGMGFGSEDEHWMIYATVCPKLGIPVPLGEKISAMNDRGKTREQIADWLESQGY